MWLSRAGLFDYDRDHGERTGQSKSLRARPASITPAARKRRNETQANGWSAADGWSDVTFKCYGEDVTVPSFDHVSVVTPAANQVVCDGLP